jgi:4-alpha-glucanotransferase
VVLFGDLPFMVALDSADVWARQGDFRLDASLGVPPDAFSATGQDWKLPVYRWDVIAEGGFTWLHQRARRNASLFGGYRVDHLVGFYRTFSRPLGDSVGPGEFTPPDEPSQTALGERILRVFLESGARSSPRISVSCPTSCARRWRGCRCPAAKCSAGNGSGTTKAARSEIPRAIQHCRWRHRALTTPSRWSSGGRWRLPTSARRPWRFRWWRRGSMPRRRAPRWTARRSHRRCGMQFIEALIASNSSLVILPVQDVFGWADRINTPATVNDRNWTWRMPWPNERLAFEPEAVAAVKRLREWNRHHRT